MKDLPKVPTWGLEWDWNLQPSRCKASNLPLSYHASQLWHGSFRCWERGPEIPGLYKSSFVSVGGYGRGVTPVARDYGQGDKSISGFHKLHETSVFLDCCSNHSGIILDDMRLSGASSGDEYSRRFCHEEGKGFRTVGWFVYFND